MKHYSVMLKECLELLDIKEDGIYVDGTLGRGGHSEEIAKRLKNGKLYTFDLDLLKKQADRIKNALGEEIGLCYAMKANPFLTEVMAGCTDRIEVCSMGEFLICREL